MKVNHPTRTAPSSPPPAPEAKSAASTPTPSTDRNTLAPGAPRDAFIPSKASSGLLSTPRLSGIVDALGGAGTDVSRLEQALGAARADASSPGTIDFLERAAISALWGEQVGAASPEAQAFFESQVHAGTLMDIATAAQVSEALSTGAPGPTGLAFTQAALADIRARTAAGQSSRVVFDIDDTLVDTRARTRAIAREFDAQQGTHHFDSLELAQVEYPPTATAQRAGLNPREMRQFMQFWQQRFFDPVANRDDVAIASTVELARQAAAAGAQVVFLTGRPQEERASTVAELERLGLAPASDEDLVMSTPVDGSDFKVKLLAEWSRRGQDVAFFITDSQADVAGVQATGSAVPAVRFDSPLSSSSPSQPGTPLFPFSVEDAGGASSEG